LGPGLFVVSAVVRTAALLYPRHVPRTPFIPIAQPKLVKAPPSGPDWLHELKFDGFRLQIHKHGGEVQLFSKGGHDYTRRYPAIAHAAEHLPVRSAIIDSELVRCDERDQPDFYGLLYNEPGRLCCWCFDLLVLDGADLRLKPLIVRRQRLADIVDGDTLRYSVPFNDGDKLLAAAEARRLEGIVSKKRYSPYVAGVTSTWLKTKTSAWRADNTHRWEHFER
jgi:bifunctional non-homologous end joining protein LigD